MILISKYELQQANSFWHIKACYHMNMYTRLYSNILAGINSHNDVIVFAFPGS